MKLRALLAVPVLALSLLLVPVQAAPAATLVKAAPVTLYLGCSATVRLQSVATGTIVRVNVNQIGDKGVRIMLITTLNLWSHAYYTTGNAQGTAAFTVKVGKMAKGQTLVSRVKAISPFGFGWFCKTTVKR